jgi:hypothetical protein
LSKDALVRLGQVRVRDTCSCSFEIFDHVCTDTSTGIAFEVFLSSL